MKKTLALILAVAMLLGMAACGKPKTTGTNPPTLKYLYNTSEGHKAIGEYLQAALKAAGITMTMENQDWATFLNTRKDGNYDVARNGWVADYTDPICFLDMWTSYSGNNDVQFGKGDHAKLKMYSLDLTSYGYETKVTDGTWAETYDVLISTIKSCTDNVKRYQLMHLAEDMLMATGCITPLYYYTDLYMIDSNVKGFFSSPLGYKYFMNCTYGTSDSISVCLASEPDTIDPALNSAVDGATLLVHLFSGIAKWDQADDGSLQIVADCATSLPEGVVNSDGTVTYTYTLRDGLKWSDGAALTANDFVYAWNRAIDKELAADYEYMFEVIKGYDEGKLAVEAVDEKTLKVTLSSAISYWNELLAFPTYFPVREDVVKNESWATDPATYVCNGPYTLTGWNHDSLMTLTKNPNYIDAASVTMGEIKCYLSDDSNNMLTNFKNGSWQLIDDVPTNEIATLKKDYPQQFVVAGQIGTYYVCWNVNSDLLPGSSLTGVEKEKAQQEIRNAISLLFDRNYICEKIAQAGQVPASSFVAMGMVNPDNTEFYKTAGHNSGFVGYYDVSANAFEANVNAAIETLKKYYTLDIQQ
ncbi:MAG: peptide ABC transporter substrate-binding protein [Lachnospiraceae bacterium]|nr:peptide ABC transporter substrate-binding protein [Lachnospiraceae bacterium]